jgi:hypothetical protein
MTDPRIVYGARCTWWDGIEKIGKSPSSTGEFALPCCPHCGSMLFEIPDPETWWSGARKSQAEGHAGYIAFIEWLKGKCFPDIKRAQAAYQAKPGRTVQL